MTGARRLFVRNVGWLLAALCAVVLVLGRGEVFSPLTKVRFDSGAARSDVRAGDRVDLRVLSLSDRHRDGASPDPEEVSLLQSLARAAGAAYRSVEARQWRDRASALETSMQSVLPAGR